MRKQFCGLRCRKLLRLLARNKKKSSPLRIHGSKRNRNVKNKEGRDSSVTVGTQRIMNIIMIFHNLVNYIIIGLHFNSDRFF